MLSINMFTQKKNSSVSSLIPTGWCRRASHHQKLAPTFPGIDSCLMVTERDFLEMEASLWLNERSQNVARGWLSTYCCWEAAVHTLDWSWKKVDVKLMMMMMTPHIYLSIIYSQSSPIFEILVWSLLSFHINHSNSIFVTFFSLNEERINK